MSESPLNNPEVYRSVLERLHTGVYIVDRDRRIVFWNRGAEQISGFLSQDVLGRSCLDEILVHCDGNQVVVCPKSCPLLDSMKDGRATQADLFLRHKLGFRIPVHIRALPLKDASGNIIGAAESFEEPRVNSITDRRTGGGSAQSDPGTGLPNAEATETALKEAVARFHEHHIGFSIMRIHVDHLGRFTTNHGPDAGLQLLRVAGQTLRNALRPADFLGGWDEQEFLAILPVHRRKALLRVAERLRALGSCAGITWWGDRISLTLSFGLATIAPGDSLEFLLSRAETALDRSVDEGGNRFTFCVREEDSSAEAESCS